MCNKIWEPMAPVVSLSMLVYVMIINGKGFPIGCGLTGCGLDGNSLVSVLF